MGRKARHEPVDFDGVRYYRAPSGYYVAPPKEGVPGRRLHRDVYEKAYGPIPCGHHVHHIDHNLENNDPANLVAWTGTHHAKHHVVRRVLADPEKFQAYMDHARTFVDSAKQGERARANVEKIAARRKAEGKKLFTCVHCHKGFEAYKSPRKRMYCSASCKTTARRKAGLDRVARTCPACGRGFSVWMSERQVCCSRKCAWVMRRAKKAA